MKQTTPYQLERARTYRAEAQRAIEYIQTMISIRPS